jgi:hypothetical protein
MSLQLSALARLVKGERQRRQRIEGHGSTRFTDNCQARKRLSFSVGRSAHSDTDSRADQNAYSCHLLYFDRVRDDGDSQGWRPIPRAACKGSTEVSVLFRFCAFRCP